MIEIGDSLYLKEGYNCWHQENIIAETTRSWVTKEGKKINKKTLRAEARYGRECYYTQDEMHEEMWRMKNIAKIERLIYSRNTSVKKLKKVFDILQGDDKND